MARVKAITYPQSSIVRDALAFVDRTYSSALGTVEVDPTKGDFGGLDTALMKIVATTGDSKAFDFLYQLTSGPLLGWIRRRAHQVARRLDGAEILQDTFINIHRYAKSFKGEGIHGFRRWARTIAANAMHRASRKRVLLFSEWTEEGVMQVPSPEATPQGLVQAREIALELDKAYRLLLLVAPVAFEKLSARDRFVLNAVDVNRSLYRDVEQELGLRSGALKMIVHRARIRLRSHLNQALNG